MAFRSCFRRICLPMEIGFADCSSQASVGVRVPDPEGRRRNGYSWLSRKAPSPLRSPGLPPSLITP